jgi:hypothetical protein
VVVELSDDEDEDSWKSLETKSLETKLAGAMLELSE